MSIKVKRGLAINLPTLEEGELGFTTDSYEMYVGSDNGNILLNNGEILIRRNNGMLQYAQSSRKNQWFDICSLEEIRGDQGVQGIQGIQGVKGDKGDKGERGIQGEKGNPFTYADFTPDQLRALKGEKGDTGAKGERGLTGDKGDRGVGLNYAWSGTRLGVKRDTDAQYTYVDLRGADGKEGKQGERGERGIQGEKGETPSIAHLEQQVSDKSKELDTKFNTLTAKQQQDAEVVTARDGEVSLHARLERDLEKGKIHFVDVEGSSISTESEEGYLENVEILGNTWQDANNLSDIRSVGTKVEGQELYEIPVLSTGKNLLHADKLVIDAKNTYGYIYLGDVSNYVVSIKDKDTSVDIKGLYFGLSRSGVNATGGVLWSVDNGNIKSTKITHPDYRYFSIHPNTKEAFEKLTQRFYVQLEEGTVATPYEPYQEHKLTILSPTPLEKVGDVADRIICKDGVWGVEKNINTYIYDGVKFSHNGNVGEFSEYVLTDTITDMNSAVVYGICDKLQSIPPNLNKETIYSNMGKIRVRLLSSMADVEKKALINEAKFKYPTTQPQFIPLPHSQQVKLRTFADRTHIHFDTEIEGTIKAQVPKSLGATVNTHTLQIDNLNKELDRVKKLEESTVSTIASDKAFTTISETTQGYFEDVKLEGKTLVNLCEDIPFTYSTTYPNRDFKNWRMLKPSTKYTFALLGDFANARDILISESNLTEITLPRGNYGQIFTFVTPSNIKEFTKEQRIYVYKVQDDLTKPQVSGWKVVILEGDHTDKDISFFEGLKSVGQGVDEISVESVNENLIPTPTYKLDIPSGASTNNYSNTIICKNIPIKPNTTYRVSYGEYINKGNILGYPLRCMTFRDKYDGDNVHVNAYTHKNRIKEYSVQTFTTEADAKYLVITIGSFTSVGNIEITKLCLTESSVEKPYTPHQSDKKQILYYNPTTQTWEKPILREWDSIEKHSDGKYYYHKRSGEVVFDGRESWEDRSSHYISDTQTRFSTSINAKPCFNNAITLVCDKYPALKAVDGVGVKGEIGINLHNGGSTIYITVLKTTLQEFKSTLQANNVTVVYQLAKEEVYECTNLDLITYSGETNLIVSSGAIQPKLTLKVLSNVSNVVKLLQEKVSILENKFIKGLQQVLAGDMMSLAYLLYPQDFTLENDTPQVIPYIEEGDINE